MNNPFDYTPSTACDEAFRKLAIRIETLKKSDNPSDVRFWRELQDGKMLGVLIATDSLGKQHALFAFSGQIGDAGFHYDGFVGPVFDYLQPDGYFKSKEAEISRMNIEIDLFENETLPEIERDYIRAKRPLDAEVALLKEKNRLAKLERSARRKSGLADATELTGMIRQSQYEKAELHRLKKRVSAELESFATALRDAQCHLEALKEKRRAESEALQKWLFDNFQLLNARGESRNLSDIFAETPVGIPPSGAGECCAPKLLQAAYIMGWQPQAIAEYWYGKPKEGEVRIHGEHYPACRGKCLPIIKWMLQGLEIVPPIDSEPSSGSLPEPDIIFENRWFCVLNKPSGMLSVPGKGKSESIQHWLEIKYGAQSEVKVAHRLDQDTSGLLIATFGQLAFKVVQSLFARRRVNKTYTAVLDGDYEYLAIPKAGRIELPLAADWLDRPRQRIDHESGKEAVTDYEFIGVSYDRSRILFHPLTGRTHQLRVHAASEMGLGMPIAGDRLYGINGGKDSERLLLHANKLEFTFPIDRNHYCFESPVPF